MERFSTFLFALVYAVLLLETIKYCQCANSTITCKAGEREALLKFTWSFTNTSQFLPSWKGKDCCEWKGVFCDSQGHVVKLDLRGKSPFVYQMFLENLEVNSCLLQLKHLTYIDLSDNHFQNIPLPNFFGSMKRLTYLNLSRTYFSGNVPHQLGKLTNLQFLDLNYNIYFFPDNVQSLHAKDINWIANLSSLHYLDLSGIYLGHTSKLIQVLNALPSLMHLGLSSCGLNYTHIPDAPVNSTCLSTLEFLDLSSNEFHGPIPLALRNMTSLRVLELSSSSFATIPHWLGNFKRLVHLDLSGSEFNMTLLGSMLSIFENTCQLKILDFSYNDGWLHGEFPEKLPGCFGHVLETLDLSNNSIGGALPYWLGELKYLKYLHLEKNALYGPIPSSLGKLSSLRELHLSSNHLNGTIPDSIGRLSKLQVLKLSQNQMTGVVPDNVGQLVNLQLLDVSVNSLEGIISEVHLGNLSFLTELILSFNKLTVELKSDWVPPFQLEIIETRNCKIETQFPHWLQTQTQVISLDLSCAGLWGTIPNWIQHMHLITYLNLSNNHITGPLPKNIGEFMPSLRILGLDNNFITGSIPNSLCNLEYLEFVDLSNNKFSGSICNCWNRTQESLRVINLSSNNLSGIIPSSIGHLLSLQWLIMRKNNISGKIPSAMRQCTELLFLDISENKLSDKIPTWIGYCLPYLQILSLRDNKFHGRVPSQLCQLGNLQILDLGHNNLTGIIPYCLGQLSAMIIGPKIYYHVRYESWGEGMLKQVIKGIELEYTTNLIYVVTMDLSCNHLVGQIPEDLTFLLRLQGLNLSYNQLSGEIPKRIGDLKRSLESLDFSNNQLTGNIPQSISELNFLSHLNLSHNNLSGQIPSGNQLQTLDDPTIYVGNPYLCGAPLLLNKCVSDHEPHGAPPDENNGEDEDGESEKIWFYLVILAGFASGFWGVIGTLLFKKSWRWAYFRYVEELADKIYVAIVLKWARLKRMIWKENTQV